MKYLVGLTALVMAQSFSAKAFNTLDVQYNNVSFTYEHVSSNKVDQHVYYTLDSISLFRINTLTVRSTPNGIQLNWMVEETASLQYFLIENSLDGQNFSPLYEVPVQLNQQTYSFVDAGYKPSDKKVYYRVKAVYPTVVIESPIRKL